jgi:protein-tyrosine-phosphatase
MIPKKPALGLDPRVDTGFPETACSNKIPAGRSISDNATAPRTGRQPLAVLFACGQNSLRSPMAAAMFGQIFGRTINAGSAGVRKGELDQFAVAVMEEIGLDISRHKPVTFEELEEREGLNFDLIVTLAPEAHHRALELIRTGMGAIDVEYWPTADPSGVEGSREQRLDAYREVRDQLLTRIRERFVAGSTGNE